MANTKQKQAFYALEFAQNHIVVIIQLKFRTIFREDWLSRWVMQFDTAYWVFVLCQERFGSSTDLRGRCG